MTAWQSLPTFVRFAVWVWAWAVVVGVSVGVIAAVYAIGNA